MQANEHVQSLEGRAVPNIHLLHRNEKNEKSIFYMIQFDGLQRCVYKIVSHATISDSQAANLFLLCNLYENNVGIL